MGSAVRWCCRLLVGLWALLALVSAQAASVRFEAPEAVQALLDEHAQLALPESDPADPTARLTLLRQARELVRSLLATEGYFAPELRWLDAERIAVEPGRRTEVQAVELQLDGALPAAREQALRRQWLLPVNAPFRQAEWDRAKQELLRDLADDGYPGAQVLHSEARIDPAKHSANLFVQVRTGPLHRYGDFQIDGLSRYAPDLIERYRGALQTGQPYRRSELLAMQQALQTSPYFDAVLIDVDNISDHPDPEVQVPVRIQLHERPPHRLSFGIGASSNTGPRLQAQYNFPDLFGQAWDFGIGTRLETDRQQYYSDLFLPRASAGYQDGLGLLYEQAEFSDLEVQRRALRLQRIVPDLQWEQRYSLTLERSDEQAAEQLRNRYQAVVPGITWIQRTVDDIRRPRAGAVWSIDTAATSEELGSDASFAYLLMRTDYFHSLSDRWVLALRTELGANWAVNSDAIPQSYLFRTGGSQTVRGYDYLSIGREVDEAIVGAKRLAVLSGELVYWFSDDWGAAMFIDAGDAKDSVTDLSLQYGYGIGARWQTPAGPLAFDFARGEHDSDIRFHFTIAVPF